MCNPLHATGKQFVSKHSLLILLIDYPLPGAHYPHHLIRALYKVTKLRHYPQLWQIFQVEENSKNLRQGSQLNIHSKNTDKTTKLLSIILIFFLTAELPQVRETHTNECSGNDRTTVLMSFSENWQISQHPHSEKMSIMKLENTVSYLRAYWACCQPSLASSSSLSATTLWGRWWTWWPSSTVQPTTSSTASCPQTSGRPWGSCLDWRIKLLKLLSPSQPNMRYKFLHMSACKFNQHFLKTENMIKKHFNNLFCPLYHFSFNWNI